jgi:hypothetical protein
MSKIIISVDPGVANLGLVRLAVDANGKCARVEAMKVLSLAPDALIADVRAVFGTALNEMLDGVEDFVFVCERQMMRFGRGSGFRMHPQYVVNNIVYGLLAGYVLGRYPGAQVFEGDPAARARQCIAAAKTIPEDEQDTILRRRKPAAATSSSIVSATVAAPQGGIHKKKPRAKADARYRKNKDVSTLLGRRFIQPHFPKQALVHHCFDAVFNGLTVAGLPMTALEAKAS